MDCDALSIRSDAVGQFCEGVDEANSYFGTSRVIDQLRVHPQWPAIVLQGGQYAGAVNR